MALAAEAASPLSSIPFPRAKESAIERRTGPLTAFHASDKSMQPHRSNTQRALRAVGTKRDGAEAATVIVAVNTPRVSHSRKDPRGGAVVPPVGVLASLCVLAEDS
eukprot:scaffold132019_cov34-Tisochrysis_lutea.AAC.3